MSVGISVVVWFCSHACWGDESEELRIKSGDVMRTENGCRGWAGTTGMVEHPHATSQIGFPRGRRHIWYFPSTLSCGRTPGRPSDEYVKHFGVVTTVCAPLPVLRC